jgi:glycosyltransferase involved in cell wall biosynthesis
MGKQTEYLLVVQAPCYRVDDRTFATESAFAEHLRVLQRSLSSHFERIWIAAPQYSDNFYAENASHLGHVVETMDHVFFVPLHPNDASAWQFWTRHVVSVWRTLRRLTRRSSIVHSGLAWDIWRPFPLFATIAAKIDRCKTLFVVDIDFRKDACRLWKTGTWSLKSYLLCRYIYDPIRLAHMYFATRTASLSLLKGANMVHDFGRGRENVRNFWDTAHSLDQVIAKPELDLHIKRLGDKARPLALIYFGRFTPYKGLDRMILAAWKARSLSGRHFVLDLIGSGEDTTRLRTLVDQLGAGEAIRLNGPLRYGEELFARIREADLMLATPLTEDTPRAAFDAMASGVPIMAFDIEYYVNLAKESDAVALSPWGDVDQFAERIVALDNDRESLVRMSRRAVDFARTNTQKSWVDRRVNWTLEMLERDPSCGEGSTSTVQRGQ